MQGFCHADYATYRYNRIPIHHPGTLHWVLDHEVYQNWVSEDSGSNFLWISGNPGCGKTVLSKFLLHHLDERAKGTDAKVAYFFCDDKEAKQKSATSLLRGLIHQLIKACPNLIKRAMKTYTPEGAQLYESFQSLWQVFLSMATDSVAQGTYIVLDAMDECEETSRCDLLKELGNYFGSKSGKVTKATLKILITSRPYPEIRSLLQKFPIIRLKTEDEEGKINTDILSFVSRTVDELATERGYDPELKEDVRKSLETGVDGMFLWVSLVCMDLMKTPRKAVRDKLTTIPRGLEALYIYLLNRLDDDTAELARNILTWVVMAPQPMTVPELATACSLNGCGSDDVGFKEDINLCGPMIKLQGDVVYLVHQSVKDFMLHLSQSDTHLDFAMNPKEVNTKLAITCLTYLSSDAFGDGPLSNLGDDFKPHTNNYLQHPKMQQNSFLHFAARYWPHFVRQGDEKHEALWNSFQRLAQLEPQLNLAFQVLLLANRYNDFTETSALEIVAYLGFGYFTSQLILLETNMDFTRCKGLFGTALHAAAYRGDIAITRVLLESGMDANANGTFFKFAIQGAKYKLNNAVIQLLLGAGSKE